MSNRKNSNKKNVNLEKEMLSLINKLSSYKNPSFSKRQSIKNAFNYSIDDE